ncbi:hypothetical protein J5A66_07095 [Prevotella sp. oral taxon 475]|uniref:hypothetical protein n=1 Tax=Prevotella sp. oral taxon 475 TaxID=712471 RepID=UPI001BA492E4|nr:hypothetical protein [Prevotella sp. oral taxon 475]QUB46745.1 hypothetical protein J5A66_07095 [Prevotella sp. oral taxon 475]
MGKRKREGEKGRREGKERREGEKGRREGKERREGVKGVKGVGGVKTNVFLLENERHRGV